MEQDASRAITILMGLLFILPPKMRIITILVYSFTRIGLRRFSSSRAH
ncbi:MAG: hypothetical protein QW797_00250 [Thermoproteota archaeon]